MRRRKKSSTAQAPPGHLITYSDLVTLLLTFFILLISTGEIDNKFKLQALGSISQQFGEQHDLVAPKPPLDNLDVLFQGSTPAHEDFNPEQQKVPLGTSNDISLEENSHEQIIRIHGTTLFQPGSTILEEKGKLLLLQLLPYLSQVPYTITVAGHSSSLRDELANKYLVNFDTDNLDVSWLISINRARSVYLFLLENGISETVLALEGFGQFHPAASNANSLGRKDNRRVELILDKRNSEWKERFDSFKKGKSSSINEVYYKDFHFDLTMPGEQ